MRILVSGGTGVVGRRLIPRLLADGHAVTGLARGTDAAGRIAALGAAPLTADLFDPGTLRAAMRGQDGVVNLATRMPSRSWKMVLRGAWRENDRIRSTGVSNLVEAASAEGVAAFLQESFALAYPDCGDAWIGEDRALAPADYNRTILDAEYAVGRFTAQGGRGLVLRFAAFYGADALQTRTYVAALRHGWAGLPGAPDAYLSSVHHDDAASAVVAALEAPAGAYNVTDNEPLRRRDYFGVAAELLGLPAPRFLPAWMTPLFGAVGEAMERSLRMSNEKLRRATGWVPAFPSAREGWAAVLRAMEEER
jgi:nucleoside-diphosphate-sugar epimerase